MDRRAVIPAPEDTKGEETQPVAILRISQTKLQSRLKCLGFFS